MTSTLGEGAEGCRTLGGGWCPTQVVGPEGLQWGPSGVLERGEIVLLNCIEAQAANQEIEPLGMIALQRASPRGG